MSHKLCSIYRGDILSIVSRPVEEKSPHGFLSVQNFKLI